MKNTIVKSFLLCMSVMFTYLCKAQEQQQPKEQYKHRYIGLGVRAAGIQLSDVDSRFIPPNRLIFDLNPVKFFRLECQWGVYNKTHEVENPSGNIDLKSKSHYIGIGIMGLYPVERAKFMGGVRYGVSKYSEDEYIEYPSPTLAESTGKTTQLSFVIGGEYFLARYFSLGAEFSLSSLKDDFNPAEPSSENLNDTKLLTEANIVFRFYPF
jgi:hypothetical protein